jgi:hypothetical protein
VDLGVRDRAYIVLGGSVGMGKAQRKPSPATVNVDGGTDF